MKNIQKTNTLITDSGFWLALSNPKDQFHNLAVDAFEKYSAIFVLTWPIITETSYLLQTRQGLDAQIRFLKGVERGGVEIFPLDSPDHLIKLRTLIQKNTSLPMDLADASLIILAEELGHGRILSTDQRLINNHRWKNHPPFQNLLLAE